MVRFSDMLGGSGESDDPSAADSPYAALANDSADLEDDAAGAEGDDEERPEPDAVKEPVPMSTFESPEAVLDRLTQYATSRGAEPPSPLVAADDTGLEPAPEPTVAEPEPPADEPLPPVGDDFLPGVRGLVRKVGRGRKRHP